MQEVTVKRVLTLAALVAAALFLAPSALAKQQVIRAPGGTPLGATGITVDASYDSRLDNLVPGYKVIDVALINQSFQIFYLNPEGDKWKIKLGGDGKLVTAIHDLRRDDPKAFSALPERMKVLLSYPLVLPVGAREVVDIFVPDTVDVSQFNELQVYLKSVNVRLEILVRQ
jgi:hypothetical protein